VTLEGLRRLSANVNSNEFYPDAEGVRAAAEAMGRRPRPRVHAFYDENSRTLHLDGGGPGRDTLRYVYAHEFAHALDGPEQEQSRSRNWRKAWRVWEDLML
jgi:hypothetical protein